MVSGVTSISTVQPAVQAKQTGAAAAANFSAQLKKAQKKSGGLDDFFAEASEKYHVPVSLLKAVAKAESGFQTDAVSSCGAQGVMQLMPSTAASLGVTDSFDPEQNIMGGAKYLGQLLSSFGGDAKLAVAAYNAGGGAVRKYGGVPPYAETQAYVKKVLAYAGEDFSASGWTSGLGTSTAAASAETESGAADETVFPLGKIAFSMGDYQLFAKIYVQKLQQNTLDTITESALQSEKRSV